jgi:hypothetical protein
MVKSRLWKRAWRTREARYGSPGEEILCIGCFEERIGRKLRRADFFAGMVNHSDRNDMSDRLRDRLADEPCVDCHIDTRAIGEWYIVTNDVWEEAWRDHTPPKRQQPILCIGCLEQRIGRTLQKPDFAAGAAVNDPTFGEHSERFLNRLAREPG